MWLNTQKIKKLWDDLVHHEGSPSQVASGFALGFYVSLLPILGFQTITALALTFLFRGNKVACLVGLHVHLVFLPVYPLIFLLEYHIGQHFLHLPPFPVAHPDHTAGQFTHMFHRGWRIFFSMFEGMVEGSWHYFQHFFLPTLLGSLVLSAPVSALSYWLIKREASLWQKARRETQLKKSSMGA